MALYDLKHDPYERINCVEAADCQVRKSEMIRLLRQHIETAEH